MTTDRVLIDIDRVAKSYPMGKLKVEALKEVSLQIMKGEFMVVLGPSGSGKTTLLNLIGGIDNATSGHIKVNGREVTNLDDKGLNRYRRDEVGFIFQFFNLIPTLTARENVELAGDLVPRPKDAMEVLGDVGLADRADHFPSELSGGEQQRVAIARALAKDPPLLLCDEPTGDLDFETGKTILGVMRRINHDDGKTVILVTHNTIISEMADRVLRLGSGEIIDLRENPSPKDISELRW
jgi:putative ABC transport system ATP-binding protein